MYQHASRYQGLQASTAILPAIRQVSLEHHVRYADIHEFVHDNPFIPPDREHIYLRGLHAGFHSDFLVSSHLLIPQIENSFREIFRRQGILTTNIDDKGIETKKDLGTLLYLPQAPRET